MPHRRSLREQASLFVQVRCGDASSEAMKVKKKREKKKEQ
jgi:hypothetical protein